MRLKRNFILKHESVIQIILMLKPEDKNFEIFRKISKTIDFSLSNHATTRTHKIYALFSIFANCVPHKVSFDKLFQVPKLIELKYKK